MFYNVVLYIFSLPSRTQNNPTTPINKKASHPIVIYSQDRKNESRLLRELQVIKDEPDHKFKSWRHCNGQLDDLHFHENSFFLFNIKKNNPLDRGGVQQPHYESGTFPHTNDRLLPGETPLKLLFSDFPHGLWILEFYSHLYEMGGMWLPFFMGWIKIFWRKEMYCCEGMVVFF